MLILTFTFILCPEIIFLFSLTLLYFISSTLACSPISLHLSSFSRSLRESAWLTKVHPSAWAGRFRIRSTASTTLSWSRSWWSGSAVSVAPGWGSQRPAKLASRPGWKMDVWVQHNGLIDVFFVLIDHVFNASPFYLSLVCLPLFVPCVTLSGLLRFFVNWLTLCSPGTSQWRRLRAHPQPSNRWSRSPSSSTLPRSMASPRLTCSRPWTFGKVRGGSLS